MDLKRLDVHFPREAVAGITVARLVEFLETGRPGMKTYSNQRGIVSPSTTVTTPIFVRPSMVGRLRGLPVWTKSS